MPTTETTVATSEGAFKYALGGGLYRMPRWMGSSKQDNTWIPYVDISWNDAIEFSTTDGLQIDLLQGKKWHGGLVGTMLWGRSTHDMRDLPSGLGTLKNTLQAGLYLEYAITPELSLGGRWRHDMANTGAAYADLYADLDLPKIGPVEHDIKLSAEFWNGAAMRRVFGVTPGEARNLGIPAYSPGAGVSQVAMNYQVFLPTSENTGFALEAGLARLTGNAASSPLVGRFGSRVQREAMAAFIVHF